MTENTFSIQKLPNHVENLRQPNTRIETGVNLDKNNPTKRILITQSFKERKKIK